jgi:phosphoglycolate phosphatase
VHLLFDLDGTLTDPREGIVACLRHAFAELGVESPPESDLVRLIGPPMPSSLRTLLGSDELAERALRAYRERFASVGLFENRLYGHVAQGLATLTSMGFTLIVATYKPTVFATRILDHFQLSHYFACVYGTELSGGGTDKAELIARALRERALHPRDAVMIGDRSHDILAARQNGVRSIGVLWGYGSRSELVDAGANVLVSTMDELVTHARSLTQQPD